MEKSEFYQLFEKIIENIIESRYISIFQIIGKLSISKLEWLKLSVIWRNYRYRYRYRNCQENYRKIIVIEKNDLSLTPSPQSRNAPPLKTAECPNNGSPSSIGNRVWLLAAIGRLCVGDPQFFMVISKKFSSQESCWRSSSALDLDIQPVRLHYIIKKKLYFSSNILIQTVAKKIELFNKFVIISLKFCWGYYNAVSQNIVKRLKISTKNNMYVYKQYV